MVRNYTRIGYGQLRVWRYVRELYSRQVSARNNDCQIIHKRMAFGNILAGGIIGAAVDMGTGSAYDYPSLISLELGMIQTIDVAKPEDSPKTE